MKNTWKIYLLALITFMVSTSEYVIAGILDKVATSNHVSVAMAGQLITVFAIANAIGSPLVVMATTKLNQRKLLMLSLCLMVLGSVMTFSLTGFGLLIVSRHYTCLRKWGLCYCCEDCSSKVSTARKTSGSDWYCDTWV